MPEDAKFCTKCGTPVTAETKKQKPDHVETVIGQFQEDTQLQDHWIRRLIAYIIDVIAVSVATGFIVSIAAFPLFISNPFGFFNAVSFPFIKGIFAVVYFVIAETTYGTTVGKHLLGLKVVTNNDQKITIEKAFMRNISKIHEAFLLLDVIVGIFTMPDLKQKYTDEISNTTVIKDDNSGYYVR